MASAMRRIGVYLGLVEDDPMNPQYEDPGYRSSAEPERYGGHHPSAGQGSLATVEINAIHTIHPRTYNDARRVGEEYRSGHPVILNLTEMDDSDAKRIVDFAAGLVFGLHGTIERVTNKVFLLSPQNVDVRDAPAVRQARDGFFNQS